MHHLDLGMSHRGRLNILVNILQKPASLVFAEMDGQQASPTHRARNARLPERDDTSVAFWVCCSCRGPSIQTVSTADLTATGRAVYIYNLSHWARPLTTIVVETGFELSRVGSQA